MALIWSLLQRRCFLPPPCGEELLLHPEQAGLPAMSKEGGRLLCQRTVRSPGQLNSSVHRRKWDFFFFLHWSSCDCTSYLLILPLPTESSCSFTHLISLLQLLLASRMFVLWKQEEKGIILIAM